MEKSPFCYKCITIYILFTDGQVKGYETVWLVGDEFCFRTAEQYFRGHKNSQDGSHNSFTYNHFEVKEFLTSKYSNACSPTNIITRLLNAVICGLNEYKGLPRLIIMVLDDDVIRCCNHLDSDFTIFFTRILDALTRELSKAIDICKDLLPEKAKRENVPHILWIAPPTHKNFNPINNEQRKKFSICLNGSISLYRNMTMLNMVKHWDHDDGNNFLREAYRFTSEGLTKYWLSVDAAVRFWFVALAKKLDKAPNAKKNSSVNSKQRQNSSRYKWTKR